MNPHMPPRPTYDPIEALRSARAVLDAWTDPGPAPVVHHTAANALRTQWPSLAGALDAQAAAEGRRPPNHGEAPF